MSQRYRLVLLRHGQSEWNAANLFTGWVNVALSPEGEREAAAAGRLLASRGLWPDVIHTSLQRRAIRTAELALTACDRDWVPVRRSWRLNSNHYELDPDLRPVMPPECAGPGSAGLFPGEPAPPSPGPS